MKIIAILIVGCVATVLGLSDEVKEIMRNHRTDCVESAGINDEMVTNACKHGHFVEDEKLKEFFFCFLKKCEFMNDAGEYQVEAMKGKLGPEVGEDVIDNVISECTKNAHGSGPDNGFEFAKCYHEKVPNHAFE